MTNHVDALAALLGRECVVGGEDIADDYQHDEALGVSWVAPDVLVLPRCSADVVALLVYANERGLPVTARGAGTGLSGACVPRNGGIVVSFEHMNNIVEIDVHNHCAIVEPGVTLDELDAALAEFDLSFPVRPGEYSASIGGNVNTNAGGMNAIKYGVTRNNVTGIEFVTAEGQTISSGGKVVKVSTGYDLTQLVIGSEGTLGIVTQATLKLQPRKHFHQTILAPFPTLTDVTTAVPKIVQSGLEPQILEYIDLLTMSAMTDANDLELGVPKEIQDAALAYLVVVLESNNEQRIGEDVERLSEMVFELGAMDVFVLPGAAATKIIEAREQAFWLAKASGANDICDIVVPRAQITEFMDATSKIAEDSASWIAGCGHAGDGNVHLGIFQANDDVRSEVMTKLYVAAIDLGGHISGEHGIGTAKRSYFLDLIDDDAIELMRRIKMAFDPNGILNPGALL